MYRKKPMSEKEKAARVASLDVITGKFPNEEIIKKWAKGIEAKGHKPYSLYYVVKQAHDNKTIKVAFNDLLWLQWYFGFKPGWANCESIVFENPCTITQKPKLRARNNENSTRSI
jgi:hypothetical protein